MKKVLYSGILILFLCTLTGCAKCINTETSTVSVKVVDEYHRPAYTTMYYNPILEKMTPLYHPAIYQITVEYDNINYDLYDKDTYNKYADQINNYVNGTLETKTYDDGTINRNIIDLE